MDLGVNDFKTNLMPVLFVGHGNPMNAIEENEFSIQWRKVGKSFPLPRSILCISAHWETEGSSVTAMRNPKTIHDFGGFPPELYAAKYSAPGDPELAKEVAEFISHAPVTLDQDWGLDHGTWSVLKQMYPKADVPVVQLSLDYTKPPIEHFELANDLFPLRSKGVLVIGSGNMVHNLGRVAIPSGRMEDFNKPFGFPWAIEANDLFKKIIDTEQFDKLADYKSLGAAVQLAIPTNEHFLPLLYALALKQPKDKLTYFNDKPLAGSLTMTSLIISD